MTPYCCLCLPGLMRKLAVKERGNQAKLSVSSIKLIPFLNDDTKYDVDLVNWVYQIVYTRSFETEDGDVKIVPMGDVSYILIVLHIVVYIVYCTLLEIILLIYIIDFVCIEIECDVRLCVCMVITNYLLNDMH